MSNATLDKKNDGKVSGEEGFGALEKVSGALPPLLILEEDNAARGILNEVTVIEDEDDGNRIFYRMTLTADASGLTKSEDKDEDGKIKYEERDFKKGEIISLPGSGGLDYAMAKLACRREKVQLVDVKKNPTKVPWNSLYGDLVVVERKEDDTMRKGKFKDKKVKSYEVSFAPRKA